ncbi:SGNH/GDSL hydrolase family protein [Methylibium sp.]|uniref:SGNH/GDSL hydrolase family protein n=1 Tax=Methylibium sp. TaxID=2067992 RepID=UPI003D0965A5
MKQLSWVGMAVCALSVLGACGGGGSSGAAPEVYSEQVRATALAAALATQGASEASAAASAAGSAAADATAAATPAAVYDAATRTSAAAAQAGTATASVATQVAQSTGWGLQALAQTGSSVSAIEAVTEALNFAASAASRAAEAAAGAARQAVDAARGAIDRLAQRDGARSTQSAAADSALAAADAASAAARGAVSAAAAASAAAVSSPAAVADAASAAAQAARDAAANAIDAATAAGESLPQNITFWGDSLTAGAGSTAYPTHTFPYLVAQSLQRSFSNYGVGGQTSVEIGLRAGVLPFLLTLAGDSIPASGSVAVLQQSGNPLTAQGGNPVRGSLCGVDGTVTRDSGTPNDVNRYTFSRTTAGPAVSCPAQSELTQTSTIANDQRIQVLWMGRNNPDQQTVDNIARFVAAMPHSRYLVVSVPNGAGETTGTPGYNAVVTVTNAQLASVYGTRYVDVRTPLVNDYNADSPQDVLDHNGDTVPASLRAPNDPIHLNDAGYGIVAREVAQRIRDMGW